MFRDTSRNLGRDQPVYDITYFAGVPAPTYISETVSGMVFRMSSSKPLSIASGVGSSFSFA